MAASVQAKDCSPSRAPASPASGGTRERATWRRVPRRSPSGGGRSGCCRSVTGAAGSRLAPIARKRTARLSAGTRRWIGPGKRRRIACRMKRRLCGGGCPGGRKQARCPSSEPSLLLTAVGCGEEFDLGQIDPNVIAAAFLGQLRERDLLRGIAVERTDAVLFASDEVAAPGGEQTDDCDR